jgi:hypothetical protein
MSPVFAVARYAMRVLARLHDEASFSDLLGQLKRRPPELDLSREKSDGAPVSTLVQTLNTLSIGAEEALGLWGDRRAYEPLMAHARDPLNESSSRVCALRAIVQLAPETELSSLLESALKAKGQSTLEQELAYGTLQGLELRPIKSPLLWPALERGLPEGLRASAAHILGLSGLSKDEQNSLLARIGSGTDAKDTLGPTLRAWIVLAGGDDQAAAKVLSLLPGADAPDSDIASFWSTTLPSIGNEEIDSGRLFRIVRNGVAAARKVQRSGNELWPTDLLAGTLALARDGRDARELPRPALRRRLVELGRHGTPEQAEGAAWTLALMHEDGFLLSLLTANPDVATSPAEVRRRAAVRRALRFADSGLKRL